MHAQGAGFVNVYNSRGGARLKLWGSVFTEDAPESMARVEELVSPCAIGQGNMVREFPDAPLDSLTDAYREANGRVR